jgi:hypothetical protein
VCNENNLYVVFVCVYDDNDCNTGDNARWTTSCAVDIDNVTNTDNDIRTDHSIDI